MTLNEWLADNSKVIDTTGWTTHEWLHFLRNVPEDLGKEKMAILDKKFNLEQSGNSEIKFAWFMKSVSNGYNKPNPKIKRFLIEVGRRKFLTPLYKSMIENGQQQFAQEIYTEARPNYHFVSTNTIDALFDKVN